MFENGVALAVSYDIGCSFANRQRRRCPRGAGIFIAKVNRLTRWIAHEIVRPWCQTIFMTVSRPRKSAARFGHHESEIFRVSDDVRPGRRRPLSFAKSSDIFATAMCEAANTIEKRDLGLSE